MIEFILSHRLHPSALILTHAHVDHIAGVRDVLSALSDRRGDGTGRGMPVWIHDAEAAWLNDPLLNLSALTGMSVTSPGPDRLLNDGETLRLGQAAFTVLHTPGHSPGGITLFCPQAGIALVGDTLFAGSVGRTDFPGSDTRTLAESIRTKLYSLPDATKVYPGHGPPTTIGRERAYNPYVPDDRAKRQPDRR